MALFDIVWCADEYKYSQFCLFNAVTIPRGLYFINKQTVVVEQNNEYSTDPISVSLAFCCIVVLSQEKKNRNGYYRYCYHHNHFTKAAAEMVFRILYG